MGSEEPRATLARTHNSILFTLALPHSSNGVFSAQKCVKVLEVEGAAAAVAGGAAQAEEFKSAAPTKKCFFLTVFL
jgi:hypothetical protein